MSWKIFTWLEHVLGRSTAPSFLETFSQHSEMLTTVCLLLSGYGCFMFHLQWQQTILAGSCTFLVYSAQRRVNYIQLHCPARRCTFSSAVMLTAVLTVNHLLCSQRYFTSASVRSVSDEKKACERVTHSCAHDNRTKVGSGKRNKAQ